MQVPINVFVVLVCILLQCTRSQADECKENPKRAGTEYARQVKEYWDSLVARRGELIKSIEDMLKEMRKNPKCISPYYKTFSSTDYAYLGTTVCGLATLRHNYEVPWKNISEVSGEEICNFLEVNGVVALERIASNKRSWQIVTIQFGSGISSLSPGKAAANSRNKIVLHFILCTEGHS